MTIIFLLMICLAHDVTAEIRAYQYGWEEKDEPTIMNPDLPMPRTYRTQEIPKPHVKRKTHEQDKLIDEKLQTIKPPLKTIEIAPNKDNKNGEIIEIEEIDSRIHELAKEKYMLESQLYFKEKNKQDWNVNIDRSGYYIGIGLLLDFVNTSSANLRINVDYVNTAAIFKLGFLRYFNNNAGLKAETFGIVGNVYNQRYIMQYYGIRFSVIKDIMIFNPKNYVGFIAGFGFGSNSFDGKIQMGINLHLGASWSFTKHHRIEIERIVIAPIDSYNYTTNYLISYSWIF